MTGPIRTFLWFAGRLQEAVDFYLSLFPGARVIETINYSDEAMPAPGLMTIEFELNGHRITAFNGGPDHPFTDSASLYVPCDTQAEIDRLWAALTADGGQEIACGWLQDRFGLHWQIVPHAVLVETLGGPDPAGAARATRVMLAATKFDIEALRAAYAGP